MKKIIGLRHANERRWVGDEFPVRTLLPYQPIGEQLSPFLILGYASPATFPPSTKAKGVGPYPHRGFEMVTIVFDGELSHKD